ncbi:MAG: GNAT family N-acetyltransferase [Candidatus Aenigmarchaeota archaeon]|nr:GNAT family N-acetyltransferase [Candidatus Aenigmarchaeota archaeon]
MEFIKVKIEGTKLFYWTWRDLPFLPYAWLTKEDLKKLPKPFFLPEIHPDCTVGFKTDNKDEYTNIIELPDSFDKIKMDNDLRKDLRRVEKKNADVKIVLNEEGALDKSNKWFLSLWKESKKDFARRLELWKQKCYTLSAYLEGELIAVHIAMQEKNSIYYFGCWWNRKYKNTSIPIFLLKKDIERAIDNKMKYYDLEIGDELYKKKWGVIEKPTKYYAVLTKEIAEILGIEKYVKINYL